tara:strand:- start:20 stop:208 length:189 start_codon:yes stop_codon:yes gene_type:complete
MSDDKYDTSWEIEQLENAINYYEKALDDRPDSSKFKHKLLELSEKLQEIKLEQYEFEEYYSS